jgi:WD40 repeat protein
LVPTPALIGPILLAEQLYSPWDQVTALAWSPDDARLAAGAGNNVHIYTFTDQIVTASEAQQSLVEETVLPVGAWSSQLLFDPFPVAGESASRLLLSARDGTLQFWDVAGANLAASWTAHRISAYSLSLNPNGVLLASSGNDALVRLWDLTAYRSTGVSAIPEIAEMIGGAFAVPAVRFSPLGELLASVDTQAIRLRQPSTQRLVTTLRAETSIFAIEFSPDGRWLAAGESDNTVRLWNVEMGEEAAVFLSPPPVPGRTTSFIWSLAFSPDGRFIAAGGSDGMLRIWSLENGVVETEWRAHAKAVTSLAFRSDGQVLASGGVDAALRLWSSSLP